MRSLFSIICALWLVMTLLISGWLIRRAWHEVRLRESAAEIQKTWDLNPLIVGLNVQVTQARRRLERLDPGPEPSWIHPLKHAEWEVKRRIAGEAHEALNDLLKQKRAVMEEFQRQTERGRMIWNGGIAPILHVLLAGTLLVLALRWGLRLALINGYFDWNRL